MAVAQPTTTNQVVDLRKPDRTNSPLMDSWRRLRRNRAGLVGLVVIIGMILMALFASSIAPNTYRQGNLRDNNSAPGWVISLFPNMKAKDDGGWVVENNEFLLGTDGQGRDLFSRIVYGSRVSLSVAFIGPMVSLLMGLALGLISGYVGGRVDNFIMRAVDVMYAFPTVLLVILMMALFRAGFAETQCSTLDSGSLNYYACKVSEIDGEFGGMLFIFVGIGLTSWMATARLARGQVLSIRQREYVEAAVSVGVSHPMIILRHILPNILGPIIVAETLTIPQYISFEAFLSFIGLGVNPPTPSWGSMIADGSNAISTYPYQAIFPAMALFMVMFAFNFLGDGLRDALDPRTRKD